MENFHDMFLKKKEEMERLYNRCIKQLSNSLGMAEKNVVRKEFSRGGECLHRGFYCPSPILDIVIGGCKRGKLLKQLRKAPDYEYCFDSHNKLILVKKRDGNDTVHEIELIYNYMDLTESIVFSIHEGTFRISCLTRCAYKNGLIQSYDNAQIIDKPFDCYEIITEKYFYNDVLTSSTLQRYNFDVKILTDNRFFYNYDSDGKMVSYTSETWDEGKRVSSVWDNHIFNI